MKKKIIIVIIPIILILIGLGVWDIYQIYQPYRGQLVGIKGLNTYHRDSCMFVKKAGIDKIFFIKDLDEAADKELLPCKSCNPPDNNENLIVAREKKAQIPRTTPYKWSASDFETPKPMDTDMTNIKIEGQSLDNNTFQYNVSLTVKNYDTKSKYFYITAIYKNNNGEPIFTQKSEDITLKPNELKGIIIQNFNNVKNISGYSLEIVPRKPLFSDTLK